MIVMSKLITKLKENEIFCFGSNAAGKHFGGAAKQAYDRFGAIWGQGEGLQGKSYGIPTMGSFGELMDAVLRFKNFAANAPEYTFLLTPVATGIAGYKVEEIAPLFKDCPDNVILPKEFK